MLDDVASVLGTTPYGSMSAFLARALQEDADGAVRHVTPLLEQSARWVEYLAFFLAERPRVLSAAATMRCAG